LHRGSQQRWKTISKKSSLNLNPISGKLKFHPRTQTFPPEQNSLISPWSCGIDSVHMVDKLNTCPYMNQRRKNEPSRTQIDDAASSPPVCLHRPRPPAPSLPFPCAASSTAAAWRAGAASSAAAASLAVSPPPLHRRRARLREERAAHDWTDLHPLCWRQAFLPA
jgi:hypothetical protein